MRAMVPLVAALGVGCSGSRDTILGWNGDNASFDRTRPQVIVTVPATAIPGITGVATGTVVTATFTEDMAPGTISNASFTLTGPGFTAIAGSVGYASSRTATFTPTFALAGRTTYTATIAETVTDKANNALSGNQAPLPGPSSYIWTFTTGEALAPSQLNLGLVQAFGQIQASADGTIRNGVVAGEPVPAQTSTDVAQSVKVRHGFYIPPAR